MQPSLPSSSFSDFWAFFLNTEVTIEDSLGISLPAWYYIWQHHVGQCNCFATIGKHNDVRREYDTGKVRVTHLSARIGGSLKNQDYAGKKVYTREQRLRRNRAQWKIFYAANKDRIRAAEKIRSRRRYALDGDRIRKHAREYYAKNIVKMRTQKRAQWRKRYALQKEALQEAERMRAMQPTQTEGQQCRTHKT